MLYRIFTLTITVLSGLALLAVPALASASAQDPDTNRTLAEVRRATAQYQDVQAAIDAGYEAEGGCVPGMGYHYGRGIAAVPGDLEATDPEILVYAPSPNGTLRLVAVEYGSSEPATLFGQEFAPPAPPGVPGPDFHTLHAWIWQGNPHGVFAPFNPNVSCD